MVSAGYIGFDYEIFINTGSGFVPCGGGSVTDLKEVRGQKLEEVRGQAVKCYFLAHSRKFSGHLRTFSAFLLKRQRCYLTLAALFMCSFWLIHSMLIIVVRAILLAIAIFRQSHPASSDSWLSFRPTIRNPSANNLSASI